MLESRQCDLHAFISTDAEGVCTYANAAAARLLRLEPAEVPGRSLWDLVADTLSAPACDQWRQAIREKRHVDLGHVQVADGRWYSCQCFPSAGGTSICLLDVTEQTQVIAAVTEERRRMDESLAVLAHELRNPLSGLTYGVTLLRRDPATTERSRILGSLEGQLHHLVRLVENLLDVSKVVRGRVELHRERIDVRQLVALAAESNDQFFDQKGHTVEINVPSGTTVQGDPTRLLQALINLLRNAAFYTDPGGTIAVAAQQCETHVEIRIRDSGRGIAPERLPHIFEQHYSYHDERAGEAGLGIGLGVVRRMVQLHGGTVSASSEGPDRGSEFVVRLPISTRH